MEEPHKIVLILGNGFDLDLGLNTSYKDFWESRFCPKDYPAPLIKHLNQSWPERLDAVKWYDLENELLYYYNSRKDNPDYPDVISPELLEYVRCFDEYEYTCRSYSAIDEEMQELVKLGYGVFNQHPCWAFIPLQDDFNHSQSWRDRKALQLIKDGLCKYLSSIDMPISESLTIAFHLLLAMTKCVKAGNTVDIYTFNYTRVQMRGDSVDDIPVHYMHGSCEDGKIIVGTRDGTPMTPEYDFLQKVMDDSYSPPDILTALDNADEVIVFGHSLGENDRQYFEQFFTKQAGNDSIKKPLIVVFTRDSNSKNDIKRSLKSLTGDRLSLLYNTNQPIIIRTDELKQDQKLFFDFLVTHHTDRHYASEVIGKLLNSNAH